MSAYENFVHDFPKRCRDLLTGFEAQATAKDREVTLMLAVASTGLIVPYERLVAPQEHPIEDRTSFGETATALSKLLSERFGATSLAVGGPLAWRVVKVGSLRGEPDHWQGFTDAKSANNKQAGTILCTIRNALAHGNIWTRDNPIRELVFAREIRDGQGNPIHYEYVRGSPQAFRGLLIAWFEILESTGADLATAAVALDEAA
jgi:hypothetical protein